MKLLCWVFGRVVSLSGYIAARPKPQHSKAENPLAIGARGLLSRGIETTLFGSLAVTDPVGYHIHYGNQD
jgi:hypothetical protein